MKLALLGDDPQIAPLVQAALAAGHELVWSEAAVVEGASGPPDRSAPIAARGERWESLLSRGDLDGVLVGCAADESDRIEQLRVLLQAGVNLLVLHPLTESMLVYYELDMIRRESGAVLFHVHPGRDHPLMQAMRELAAPGGSLGTIEQLTLHRELPDRSQRQVLDRFCRDVDWITSIVGPLDRVAALGAVDEAAAYANLGVQMSGPRGTAVRWSVGPVETFAGARATLRGTTGTAELTIPDDSAAPWHLALGNLETANPIDVNSAADFPETLASFEKAVHQGDDGARWGAAALSVELTDAVGRSVRRGRTIVLYAEQHSEQTTFRGLMTTLGCGLVLAVIVVATLAGLFGDALGIAPQLMHSWPIVLLVVLAFFLLLQLLPLIVFSGPQRAMSKNEPDH